MLSECAVLGISGYLFMGVLSGRDTETMALLFNFFYLRPLVFITLINSVAKVVFLLEVEVAMKKNRVSL